MGVLSFWALGMLAFWGFRILWLGDARVSGFTCFGGLDSGEDPFKPSNSQRDLETLLKGPKGLVYKVISKGMICMLPLRGLQTPVVTLLTKSLEPLSKPLQPSADSGSYGSGLSVSSS